MEENISRAAGAVPQLIDVKASEQLVAPLQRNFRQRSTLYSSVLSAEK
jgi:hypothetical protein